MYHKVRCRVQGSLFLMQLVQRNVQAVSLALMIHILVDIIFQFFSKEKKTLCLLHVAVCTEQ